MKSHGEAAGEERPSAVRDRILSTATKLFYRSGVHAVGVDLVVAESGIAKTSLYRHFGNKDGLVAAFLKGEDADFWRQWDAIADRHPDDPKAELAAYLEWMETRLRRPNYRGCPQLNVAAEIPDRKHPARRVAEEHKQKMRDRFSSIARRLGLKRPNRVGAQLALAFDGAFITAPISGGEQLSETLKETVAALVKAGRAA